MTASIAGVGPVRGRFKDDSAKRTGYRDDYLFTLRDLEAVPCGPPQCLGAALDLDHVSAAQPLSSTLRAGWSATTTSTTQSMPPPLLSPFFSCDDIPPLFFFFFFFPPPPPPPPPPPNDVDVVSWPEQRRRLG